VAAGPFALARQLGVVPSSHAGAVFDAVKSRGVLLVAAEAVPEVALAAGYSDWPTVTLPVFVDMMFAAILAGNATLIGASANIVSAGTCASHGQRVTFAGFARYGVPITVVQLALSAVYVLALGAILNW
jgi:Na+/H+ antiporter NhaD/arsenite permease-like protein